MFPGTRAERQIANLRGHVEPRRRGDRGEDDEDRRGRNEGSANRERGADLAPIFLRNRRDVGRRTVAGRAENGARPGRRTGAAPILVEFRNMPDREPELECQRQQPEPHAAVAWYQSRCRV